ncbi:hypothetical protein U1Q18_047141 [Sarracenia purpurea var. burkii]
MTACHMRINVVSIDEGTAMSANGCRNVPGQLCANREQQKKYFNQSKVEPESFEIGDPVFVQNAIGTGSKTWFQLAAVGLGSCNRIVVPRTRLVTLVPYRQLSLAIAHGTKPFSDFFFDDTPDSLNISDNLPKHMKDQFAVCKVVKSWYGEKDRRSALNFLEKLELSSLSYCKMEADKIMALRASLDDEA